MTDQDSVPARISARSWAAVTSVGLGLAFLSFIPGMLVMDLFLPQGLTNMGATPMPEVLDPDALPAWLDAETYKSWYRMHLGYHVVALIAFGSIVGWFQSRVLHKYVPVLRWVAATAIGFVAILCFEILERHVVIGPHGGSIEPLMISIGGSTMAGLGQWWVLRQCGVHASRWLAFWIIGVVVGVGSAVATIIGVELAIRSLIDQAPSGVLAQAISWGGMLLTLGLITGAVAGGISARALNSSLTAARTNSRFTSEPARRAADERQTLGAG